LATATFLRKAAVSVGLPARVFGDLDPLSSDSGKIH